METERSPKKIIFALTIAVLFFLIIIILVLLPKTKSYPEKERISPSPIIPSLTSIPTKEKSPLKGEEGGEIILSAAKKNASLMKREKIIITAKVNSNKRDVVSFDLIFKFDKKGLNLDKVIPLSPDFDLFKKPLSDGEIITGVKKIGRKEKIILNNDQLIKLIFSPKKEGSYTIAIVPTDKMDKTQFVDHETKIIYPEISNLKIAVNQ